MQRQTRGSVWLDVAKYIESHQRTLCTFEWTTMPAMTWSQSWDWGEAQVKDTKTTQEARTEGAEKHETTSTDITVNMMFKD